MKKENNLMIEKQKNRFFKNYIYFFYLFKFFSYYFLLVLFHVYVLFIILIKDAFLL